METTTLINAGEPFLYRDHTTVGLSATEFRAAFVHGDVVRLIDRVYVDARAEDSRELRVAAARLVVPAHAVVSDETAAWIWGVDAYKPSDRHRFVPQWVVPHGRGRTRIEGLACRQALIADEDVLEVGGLAVTHPVRTTSDLLRKQWRPYAMASADAMAHAGLVRPMDVRAYVARLKGYRGIRQARVLAQLIEPKSASPGESWTRLRLVDAGFPRPVAQVEVEDAAGLQRFLDLAYVRRRIAVEYDGREFHTADPDDVHDEERRRLLVAVGYRFVVTRYERVFGTDPAFENEVGELLGMTPIARWW
ncbi:hypothetical protein [Aeromicrobium chenweiae]|uniref:Uncharacterized protein n=1 Tax=Aeromicrobium chenweiae TaxID=2079793 RepID=A0A2S0WL93_9ACTN|nr:hypothetical protein [Aeromicrobium chenweiae]AWB92034.1 hypothetical protein C3E78_07395 [Aeromicrobium chenweiae]TGN32884.1 hypothetical protein E4L97_09370 [Aeromicrobium chenweiae]